MRRSHTPGTDSLELYWPEEESEFWPNEVSVFPLLDTSDPHYEMNFKVSEY